MSLVSLLWKGWVIIKTKDTKSKKIKLPHGDGSIFYVSRRHSYAGEVTLTIDGKKTRKTVYGKTEKIVKNKLRELQIQALAGNLHNKNNQKPITIFDLADKMIEEQLALNEIRQSTYERKKATLKMLDDISDRQIQTVSEDDIKEFFANHLYYSQSCINKMYQLLGWVFQKSIRKKLINENPLTDIKRPKSTQKKVPVRALTINEQVKLLKVLKSEDIHYSEIMLLSMFTGIRAGECCALKVEDIDFVEHTISVSKTVTRGTNGRTEIGDTKTYASTRTVFVNDEIIDFLSDCVGEKINGLIFKSRNGKLVTTNQVNYSYSNALRDYGIIDDSIYGKVDLHSLRHTFATRCIESGMPAKVLQKILGHTDISITLNTYCSVFEKYRNEHLAVADEYMKANNLAIA